MNPTNGDGFVLVDNFDCAKALKDLDIIKEQYEKMYNAVIATGEYEKYQEIENTIIEKLAQIELELDTTIRSSSKNYKSLIAGIIESIRGTGNYKSYTNIDEELEKVQTLKQLAKLCTPYISAQEEQEVIKKITDFKFEMLLRKQVEELVYKNGGKSSSLMQYDSKEEKQRFIELLRAKIKRLSTSEYDEVLKLNPQEILEDNKLLERLLMLDMKNNSLDYVGLVNAKLFNPHLFHITENPFEAEGYCIEEHKSFVNPAFHGGPFPKNWMSFDGPWYFDVVLIAEKVNFSLLVALLKSVITDENIGIAECENLYRRFGFECIPMKFPRSLGQKCVQMVWKNTKDARRKAEVIMKIGSKQEEQEVAEGRGIYCGIDFKPLRFESYDQWYGDLSSQILSERKVERKRSGLFFREDTSPDAMDDIQFEKMKVSQMRRVSPDVDVLILQLADVLYREETKMEMEKLREFKNANRQLTLEEARFLIGAIQYASDKLYCYGHWTGSWRQWLPLESLGEQEQIPKAGIDPLWEKYEKECEELGIRVKRGKLNKEQPRTITVYVNLDDILDLPIDYEKVKNLPKVEDKNIERIKRKSQKHDNKEDREER